MKFTYVDDQKIDLHFHGTRPPASTPQLPIREEASIHQAEDPQPTAVDS